MKISFEKVKPIFKITFFVFVLSTLLMFWYGVIIDYFSNENEYEYDDTSYVCPENSNVALIKMYGKIMGYEEYSNESRIKIVSDSMVNAINQINKNENIKAIIVEIASGGGEPVASEEIYQALKRTEKPTVALIKEGGASGAYMIAIGTDKIYASKMSQVGGIGVTWSYLDYSKQNEKEGLTYQQLSSGKYKDIGDIDKELTDEERELIMRDVNKVHKIFVEMVAENRALDFEYVDKLADGSTMLGIDAKEVGLIDEIGDLEDVKEYLSNKLDIEPIICIHEEITEEYY